MEGQPASSILSQAQELIKQHLFILAGLLSVSYLLWDKFQPGLVSIPGPAIAAYTKWWRVYNVWQGSAHLDAIALHKKYGNLVRIAPNVVSVADPKWIPVFYGPKELYRKVPNVPSLEQLQYFIVQHTKPNTSVSFLPNPNNLMEEAAGTEPLLDPRPRFSSQGEAQDWERICSATSVGVGGRRGLVRGVLHVETGRIRGASGTCGLGRLVAVFCFRLRWGEFVSGPSNHC
jgi:hypothetical protein